MDPQVMPQAYNPYTTGAPTPVAPSAPATQAPAAPAMPTGMPMPPTAAPTAPVAPTSPTATSLQAAVNTATNQPQPTPPAMPTDNTAAAASSATVQPTMNMSADAQPLSPINGAMSATGQAAAPQAAPKNATPDNPISTQSTLLISELRDGLVIMKDGSFRAVIACQSINFDLMSENEREGAEYAYQDFLNSLNFTTQILIRSQRVDIGPYIERLTEIRKNNDNMLLGVLMDDYIDFIDRLSQEANIMDKSFFIVIPYYTSAEAEKVMTQTRNFFSDISKKKTPEVFKIDRATYDKAITEINNRVETVMSGLFKMGVRAVRLNTRELGALYYNFNNPDTAVREPLVDFTKLATTYVKKGEKENV